MSICDKYKVDFAANDAAIQRLNPSVSYSYLLPGNIILIPSTTYPPPVRTTRSWRTSSSQATRSTVSASPTA